MEEEGATAFGQQTLKRAILQATQPGGFGTEKTGTSCGCHSYVHYMYIYECIVTCHMPIYFHVIFHKMY